MYGSGASATHRMDLWPREEPWTGGGRGGPGVTRGGVGWGGVGWGGVGSGGVVWCGVVWCGVVCRRRCYQKAKGRDVYPRVQVNGLGCVCCVRAVCKCVVA